MRFQVWKVIQRKNDEKAGTKHSLYGHYGTNKGVITAEDVLMVPDVIAKGERMPIKRGNTQLYKYTLSKNGMKYTVQTEKNNRGIETFADFYTNKKASSTARKTHSEEAQADIDDASRAKVQQNSDSTKELSGKIREHRVYHGSGADFDAFDHSLIGTGEGSQVFGWGTYVSEVEGVGRILSMSQDKNNSCKQRALDIVNGENATLSKAQKRAAETATLSETSDAPLTVVSTADGAKVLNNLNELTKHYDNLTKNNTKTFLGDVAQSSQKRLPGERGGNQRHRCAIQR